MRKLSEGYRRDQTSLPVLPLVCHFGTSYSHRLCLTITCNRDVIYKAGSTRRIAVPPQADRAAITGNTRTEELGDVRTGGFWADRQTDKQARSSQHSAWLPRGEGAGELRCIQLNSSSEYVCSSATVHTKVQFSGVENQGGQRASTRERKCADTIYYLLYYFNVCPKLS